MPLMTERSHPERHPTPAELQAELSMFYERIPFSDYTQGRDHIEKAIDTPELKMRAFLEAGDTQATEIKRRFAAESIPMLTEKLAVLIAHAPITESFKKQIVQSYKVAFVVGRQLAVDDPAELAIRNMIRSKNRSFDFTDLIDDEAADAGGVFNPAHAMRIEQRAYQNHVRATFLQKRLIESPESGIPMLPDILTEGLVDSLSQKMQTWRVEFTQHYNQEP
jgi:hypothetical protein